MKARISSVIMSIGLAMLSVAGSALAQTAGTALGLKVSANQSIYHPGDKLTVSVSLDDPGVAANADFYFGMLMPDGTIRAFSDLSFNSVTCSIANLSACHPIVPNVSLTAPFTFNQPAFFTHDWTGSDALGSYTLIAAAVVPGALADNTPGSGDLIAVSAQSFRLDPGTVGGFPQLSGTYKMALTSATDIARCAADFGNTGPYTCAVTQSGSTVTFDCTPSIPGLNPSNPMNLDVNGFTLFTFLREDGRLATCSMQFNTFANPLTYHALCDVKAHGSQANTCVFDATQ